MYHEKVMLATLATLLALSLADENQKKPTDDLKTDSTSNRYYGSYPYNQYGGSGYYPYDNRYDPRYSSYDRYNPYDRNYPYDRGVGSPGYGYGGGYERGYNGYSGYSGYRPDGYYGPYGGSGYSGYNTGYSGYNTGYPGVGGGYNGYNTGYTGVGGGYGGVGGGGYGGYNRGYSGRYDPYDPYYGSRAGYDRQVFAKRLATTVQVSDKKK